MGAQERLAAIAARVEPHIEALFAEETDRWSRIDSELVAPLEVLRRLVVQGGKRLRPAFCYWGFVAGGGASAGADDVVRLERAAAAFELLHAFALIHDDVMDDAAQRRGITTAHIEYAGLHAAGEWRGEQRRFGESIAILLGDLAHVYAEQLMTSAQPGPTAATLWRDLQTELMMGQYLDVVGTARADRSPDRARLIALLKSGRYTIERPLQLGAALVDASAEMQKTLHGYGAPLGEAFQLRDDMLGAFGHPDVVGKPVGSDLREGKPTPLLAHAVANGSAAQRARLQLVGTEGLTERDIDELQYILVATGAQTAMEQRIRRLVDEAIRAIDVDQVPSTARVALIDLAHFVSDREH